LTESEILSRLSVSKLSERGDWANPQTAIDADWLMGEVKPQPPVNDTNIANEPEAEHIEAFADAEYDKFLAHWKKEGVTQPEIDDLIDVETDWTNAELRSAAYHAVDHYLKGKQAKHASEYEARAESHKPTAKKPSKGIFGTDTELMAQIKQWQARHLNDTENSPLLSKEELPKALGVPGLTAFTWQFVKVGNSWTDPRADGLLKEYLMATRPDNRASLDRIAAAAKERDEVGA
jgi:hypothetical protein